MITTSFFRLVTKRSLTRDVWELDFMVDASLEPSLPASVVISTDALVSIAPERIDLPVHPGQYILFILPSGLRRAYSIGYSFEADTKYVTEHMLPERTQIFRFVIKRLDHVGAGSQEVCDTPIGGTLKGMWPMGHFALPESSGDTLFIGTGTGFAPLYYQMRSLCDQGAKQRLHYVFGVRSENDIFYHDELEMMIGGHTNLSFTQYLSQPVADTRYTKGYVTDYLIPENIAQYQTFSICGSPVMVKNAREILESAGVSKDQIKFEQY